MRVSGQFARNVAITPRHRTATLNATETPSGSAIPETLEKMPRRFEACDAVSTWLNPLVGFAIVAFESVLIAPIAISTGCEVVAVVPDEATVDDTLPLVAEADLSNEPDDDPPDHSMTSRAHPPSDVPVNPIWPPSAAAFSA